MFEEDENNGNPKKATWKEQVEQRHNLKKGKG